MSALEDLEIPSDAATRMLVGARVLNLAHSFHVLQTPEPHIAEAMAVSAPVGGSLPQFDIWEGEPTLSAELDLLHAHTPLSQHVDAVQKASRIHSELMYLKKYPYFNPSSPSQLRAALSCAATAFAETEDKILWVDDTGAKQDPEDFLPSTQVFSFFGHRSIEAKVAIATFIMNKIDGLGDRAHLPKELTALRCP